MQTIKEAVRENDNIITLTIASDGMSPFSSWTPGQFLRISVKSGQEWSEEHTFTISSAPEEMQLRVSVKAVGPFTTSLQAILPGTHVHVHGPYGKFCKDIENFAHITMIAGGIGITPFLSVLRHLGRIGAKNHIVLFWANNTLSDIIRREELTGITGMLNLHIVHVLWKETGEALVNQTGNNQHFTTGLLTPEIIQKYTDVAASEFFMCGPPKMNDYATGILDGIGIAASKIHTEAQVPPPPKKTS